MNKDYFKEDIGCYADGTFGHNHVREILAGLIQGYNLDLAEELRKPMSDDASEENEALDILDNHCDGVSFILENGDLMLIGSEEL